MPEFSISSEPNLSDTLQAMGMAGAFAGGADYSGITSAPGVVLQQVAQADAITVNESGTNASAVSGVQSGRISQRGAIEEISFDRPFLFVIRDIATGAIVSDAVVADLSQP
jgi:serpin B